MTRTVFANDMVAHVWAQGRQAEGKSGNGNFYFEGPTLYSYGSHFVAGFLLAPGRALINSDSYSISTAKHLGLAQRAVAYQGLRVPGLTDLARILRRGSMQDYRPEARTAAALAEARGVYVGQLNTWAEGESFAKYTPQQAEAVINRAGVPSFPAISAEALAACFEYLGHSPAEASKAAAKALTTRARNKAAWAAKAEAVALADQLETARQWAAKAPAEIQAELINSTRGQYFSAERDGARWLATAKELFRAAKAAKGKGWTRVAAEVKAREKLIRGTVATWEAAEGRIQQRKAARRVLQLAKAARPVIAAALADQQGNPAPLRALIAEWAVGTSATVARVADQGGEAFLLLAHVATGAEAVGADYTAGQGLTHALRAAGLISPATAEAWRNTSALLTRVHAKAGAGQIRARNRRDVVEIRAWRDGRASAKGSALVNLAIPAARALAQHLGPEWQATRPGQFPNPTPFKAAGWNRDNLKAWLELARADIRAAQAEVTAERERAAEAWNAASLAAWLANEPQPPRPAIVANHYTAARLSDHDGGALLRATKVERDESGAIVGGTLQTSWGAEVPLTHAVRAFRFLIKCRAEGRTWRANGKTLPVGHFRVDQINSDGGFRAGCHVINWPAVERVASALGLLNLAPADTTEPTHA